ncbi:MAG: DNA replication/repair protein RecF [Rheinheimera sp.]|nr:DNA replication/repair protein RecF [Gammaproteobacteria bacterium]MDZ7904228.1 DNA replication/repair protein RecF [Rheinheimera sp.]
MALQQLQLSQFRNIESAQLSFSADWNLIYGANGSGKTSVLEAIYLLAHGRSFRTSKAHKVIRHEQALYTVFARIGAGAQQIALGVQRDRAGDWLARLNGEKVQRVADCASLLPVQLITPESFRLFFGGPKERRQFFDMGLFHVEHQFYEVWMRFNKVLKQRNALLKSRQTNAEFYQFWDQQFVELAIQLQSMRVAYIELLNVELQNLIKDVPALLGLQLELVAGWNCRENNAAELTQQLRDSFAMDLRVGYSQLGPQKADLRVKVRGEYADELLSRGQLKVLLFSLKIAQSNVIYRSGHKQPLLLIDDLASELDDQSKRQIFNFLYQLNSQVFITAIETSQVLPQISSDTEVALFHVEHGQIERTDENGRRT